MEAPTTAHASFDPLREIETSALGIMKDAERETPDAVDDGGRRDRAQAYARYISSRNWLESPARIAELEASGRSCRLCDRGAPEVRLQVHHRTYQRFGRELTRDLTTVCEDCHLTVTDALRARRHAAMRLPAPRDASSFLPPRLLAISEWIDDDAP